MYAVRTISRNPINAVLRQVRWLREADQILTIMKGLAGKSAAGLLQHSYHLRQMFSEGDSRRADVLTACALAAEAVRRETGMTPYVHQLIAGLGILDGFVVELGTGEGKTISALFPAYVHSLAGRGCHVVTANEYLASRDAEFASQIFASLGVTAGVIRNEFDPLERHRQYRRDVTYATPQEIGFDYLRDVLREAAADRSADQSPPIHREFYAAVIDEADSVLIDEAGMPLVMADRVAESPRELSHYSWCHAQKDHLDAGTDFEASPTWKRVELTDAGKRKVTLLQKNRLSGFRWDELFSAMASTLTAAEYFRRDRDYLIDSGGVQIIDPHTGRITPGRQWQRGIQTAIEIQEKLTEYSRTAVQAQTTIQLLFRRYSYLGGMTGTLSGLETELQRYYRLSTIRVAPRLPERRRELPPRIFRSRQHQFAAIVASVALLQQQGRAVLVGTRSVRDSEDLAELFSAAEIPFQLMNAANHRREALVIAQAGQVGQVTIATNMAGRGTDIKVAPEVLARGGLHIVLAQVQASARVDRQLIGRTGRQGEPGTFQYILSFEDDLFRQLPEELFRRVRRHRERLGETELPPQEMLWFRDSQRFLEQLNSRIRQKMYRSVVAEHQRLESFGLVPELNTP